MGGLLIEYRYDGDEAVWQNAVESFIKNIAADARLRSSFRYHVFVKEDGVSRVHVPSWDSEETLKHLQSQPFFSEFAGHIKSFAGDSLSTTKIKTS